MPCPPGWFAVRVTPQPCLVLAPGEVPKVKIWHGRLGRFLPRSEVPPFDAMEAWFYARKKQGKWEFGERCEGPGRG